MEKQWITVPWQAIDLPSFTTLGGGSIWLLPSSHKGDPKSVLTGVARIAGVGFHVEAIEVRDDPYGAHRAVVQDFDTRVEALENAMDGKFETITIEGREYVLSILPFCS